MDSLSSCRTKEPGKTKRGGKWEADLLLRRVLERHSGDNYLADKNTINDILRKRRKVSSILFAQMKNFIRTIELL